MTDPRPHVLVVADPARARQYAEWILDDWWVRTATEGGTALRTVDATVDVVVLAGDLPDRPVRAVERGIRNRGHDCQIVRVGGDPSPDSPADESLSAPLDEHTLRDCIQRVTDRITYDERLREYFTLVSRKALLETYCSPAELVENDEYTRLAHRTWRLSRQLDDLHDDVSDDGYDGVFRALFPGRVGA